MNLLLVWFSTLSFAQVSLNVQKDTYVIKATSMSCLGYQRNSKADDVASPYFDIYDMRIANRTTTDFIPAALVLHFTSGKGKNQCDYFGDSLQALGFPEKMTANEILDIGCPMKCGGLNIGHESIQGTIELFGYSENPDGTTTPVRIQKNIQIINPNY